MAKYNALRINKNDQKKKITTYVGKINKGVTGAQLNDGLLVGYTPEKAIITNTPYMLIPAKGGDKGAGKFSLGNAATNIGNAAVGITGTVLDTKVGTMRCQADVYSETSLPITVKGTGLSGTLNADVYLVLEFVELEATTGELVGPNTANLRAPLDETGTPCVEFPDVAPNTRAF